MRLPSLHPTRHARILILCLASCCALGLPAELLASGGGGGSGGGAPQRDPTPFYQKGIAALRSGQYAEAEKQFGEVLGIVPQNAQANYMMGLAHEGKQDFKNAARSYKQALRIDRKLYDARAHLGTTALRLGARGDAERQLKMLQEADAKCAQKCLADEQNRIRSAMQLLKAALAGGAAKTSSLAPQQAPAPADGYQQAVSLLNAGRYDEAIESLRRTEATAGPSADTLNYLGYAHRKLQRYDEAKQYYTQALAIEPLHRGANEYLGELYIETGHLELALTQLQKLQALCAFGCAEEEELRRWLAQAR